MCVRRVVVFITLFLCSCVVLMVLGCCDLGGCAVSRWFYLFGGLGWMVKNGGSKIVKNGPRVWAFCKIEFPGIQKPVQILTQKSGFFGNPGNRGVGVIWLVGGVCLVLSGRCGFVL